MVSRRHIPRGCRTNYIPGLTEAYKKHYSSNPFAEGTLETGNKLIDTMKEAKKKRWEEVITSIDLAHNSCKTWQTIKKLSNDPTSPNPPYLVNSNQVAHHLLVSGQGTMPTKPKCPALPTVEGKPSLVSAFSEEEYRKGIAALKNNKAADIDDILVEQLKNLGPKAHKWLYTMLNTCFIENKIPKIWRQSKTGFTCSKEQRQRWRYEGDTTCECGLATENTAHMMRCTLLAQPCSLDDLNHV